MVAQAGKAAYLKERGDAIAAFLKEGVAVCLVDVRGTGETKAGSSAERGSSRTSISQTELILGRTVLGNQLRDLRTVIRWLQNRRPDLDGKRVGVWGESFTRVNEKETPPAPLDAPDPPVIAEPGAAHLAYLAGLFEDNVRTILARGGLSGYGSLLESPYVYVPHDVVVPGIRLVADWSMPFMGPDKLGAYEATVDGRNRMIGFPVVRPVEAAWRMVKELKGK
jgi:hypothetical protein